MIGWLCRRTARFRNDDGGTALILISMALPAIFGMAAFAIDLGYAFYIKTKLQTAADLGALAGGTLLYKADKSAVEAKALEYVNLNLPSGWNGKTAASISVTPAASTACLTSLVSQGLTCDGATKANALKVSLNATAPLFFASALGFRQASFSASAMVSGANAAPPPLNIAIVLDTTASMNSPYTGSCGGLTSPTKLQCAVTAIRGMLGTLWPSVNQVALFTYPGVTTSSIPMEYCAPKGTVTVVNYKVASNPKYKIIDFSTDYRGAGTPPPPGLNTASNLVKVVGGNPSCSGIQAIGGAKTFFADTIVQAQAALDAANAALVAAGQPPRQNVMMILSDGDANAASTNIDAAKLANQCLQGITAAKAAASSKTWVYSIAYQAGNNLGSSCTTDTTTATTTTTKITTTTTITTTPYSQTCLSSRSSCNSPTAGTVQTTKQVQTATYPGVVQAPAGSTTTTSTAPSPTCSPRTNCTSNWSTTTVTVSSTASVSNNSLTTNDRTACKTMREMASDPTKFYSVAGSSGCISDSNPSTTDLVSIFKNVAVSLMKKRRIPLSVL